MTEKSLDLAAKGWYTFKVDIDAPKKQIASAISRLYNVTVKQVRTILLHGKVRRVGRKMLTVTRPNWKKALVQLSPGQTIEAFTTTSKEEANKK